MATKADQIILYDIPTKEPRKCSSPNTWKIRALLNYKNISYETVWLEYPEIEPTLRSFGLAENTFDLSKGVYTKYWCPVVKLPDGTYIMESHNIALALEKLYPQPALDVDSELTKKALGLFDAISYAIAPAYIYRLADDNFKPEIRDWYHHQRATLWGKEDLYGVAKMEPWAGETPWQNASDSFANLAALLHEDESGPFFAGKTPSYADLIIVSQWMVFRLMDRHGDVYGRVMGMDPAFPRLAEACKKWFERDSY